MALPILKNDVVLGIDRDMRPKDD
ncbi:uncharacterized protein G2W53_044703 [Senna tora]|uniref:Uncharacterized protein n=1 Tax=Senna tora TaxID=362788 RepID=A0A834SBT3_9FABA|nr:uncharacterized protein G2W53_044703 [Senna tora]